MHELAITQSMIELVHEHADRAGAARVRQINLVLGALSGCVNECVQLYFDMLAKGSPLEGARLSFKCVPATGHCRDCGLTFEIVEPSWVCPDCGNGRVELAGGGELYVESIEVD